MNVSDICNQYDGIFDPRHNWPSHFFDTVCKCNSPYAGYDCGECEFGRRGINCSETYVRVRRSVRDLSDSEWQTYQEQLSKAKNTTSNRYVTLTGYNISNSSNIVNTTVYDLFVWYHHNAAYTHRVEAAGQSSVLGLLNCSLI